MCMCIYRERKRETDGGIVYFKELVCSIVREGRFEICKAGCPARNSRRGGGDTAVLNLKAVWSPSSFLFGGSQSCLLRL